MSIAELSAAFGGRAGGPPDDRVPPQDLHAEQSVLGSMLLNKDAIADCLEAVKAHDFYRPAHELIFDAVLDLFGRGEPADAITVADELGKRGDLTRVGGQAYLHQLIQSVPTAANAGYYAEIVHERAVLRRLVEAGTRIVQMGYAPGRGRHRRHRQPRPGRGLLRRREARRRGLPRCSASCSTRRWRRSRPPRGAPTR